MHYIKSSFRSNAFRRSSVFLIAAYLSSLVAAGMTIYTFLQNSDEHILAFGIVLAITLVLWILVMIVSGTCRCQLCQASTMRSLKCSPHKKAKSLFGSYRLFIAVAILFKGAFRCSYCGEAFSLKSADPKQGHPKIPDRKNRPHRRAEHIPAKRY